MPSVEISNFIHQNIVDKLIEDVENKLIKQTIEWNYVDGEEGDSGIIHYYVQNDSEVNLFMVRRVNPGDDVVDTLTEYGETHIKNELKKLI